MSASCCSDCLSLGQRRVDDVVSVIFVQESAPHARGRQECPCCTLGSARITPACAGKTPVLEEPVKNKRHHPRMRGEDSDVGSNGEPDRGSPPHARGRLVEAVAAILRGRITPACAGKTRWTLIAGFSESDHPRMRGEDSIGSRPRKDSTGSPPHARGRLNLEPGHRYSSGITPACAGKTGLPCRCN